MGKAQDLDAVTDEADALEALAAEVLRRADALGLTVATAESCTGGLIASLLTDVEGLSSSFERGFVVYTDEAKAEMLGIDQIAIRRHGAVSAPIARAMAQGVIARSRADLAIAVTGFAGPAGRNDEAGLVHIAVQSRAGRGAERECHFGNCGRQRTRELAVEAALKMAEALVERQPGGDAAR